MAFTFTCRLYPCRVNPVKAGIERWRGDTSLISDPEC